MYENDKIALIDTALFIIPCSIRHNLFSSLIAHSSQSAKIEMGLSDKIGNIFLFANENDMFIWNCVYRIGFVIIETTNQPILEIPSPRSDCVNNKSTAFPQIKSKSPKRFILF